MNGTIGSWVRATRPQFLTITVVAVGLGLAGVMIDGVSVDRAGALLSLLGALCMHAGANLINDFHDRDADAVNCGRLTPFTGGSRMIQDGAISAAGAAVAGYLLVGVAALVGMYLLLQGKTGLVGIGLAGIGLAVAYSAPPIRLSARGCGELAVAAAWLLVVAGTDMVQRGDWSMRPLIVGVPLACLIAAILWINEYPDHAADLRVGKRTLVVVLGPARAARTHLLLLAAPYTWVVVMIGAGHLPPGAALGILGLPWSLFAGLRLLRVADAGGDSRRFLPVVKATILAAHLHGLGLIVGMWLGDPIG